MKARSFLVLIFSLFSIAASEAQVLKFSEIAGKYGLVKNVKGFCPQNIKIEVEEDQNSKSGLSLDIFCADQAECSDPIVYQFTDLNAGPQKTLTRNSVNGLVDGLYYSSHRFEKSNLTGEDKMSSILGRVLWKSDFAGNFEHKILSYKLTETNYMSTVGAFRSSECVYRKR